MAIYKGDKKVVAVYKGSTPINKIYKGSTLFFQTGGGSQSVPVIITFTNDSDPAKRKYTPVCEGTEKTATSQTIELPSEGETYKFVNKDTLLEVRNYSNNCPSVTSFNYLFDGASNMKTLSFAKGMDTSDIESMSSMFYDCSTLVSIDLSSFDVTNLTNVYAMLYNCKALTSLILPDFSKSSLSDIRRLFGKCSSLGSIDLSSFNTSNCTSFEFMFYECRSLGSIDLSNFDTSNCTNFSYMFNGCSSLSSIDLSNFDTSNSTSFSYMFFGCSDLTHIKCKQAFKDWCITNQNKIWLPTAMQEGGSGTWEIVG